MVSQTQTGTDSSSFDSLLCRIATNSSRKESKHHKANRKMKNRTRCTKGYSQYGDGRRTPLATPRMKAYNGFHIPLTAIDHWPRQMWSPISKKLTASSAM